MITAHCVQIKGDVIVSDLFGGRGGEMLQLLLKVAAIYSAAGTPNVLNAVPPACATEAVRYRLVIHRNS